MIPTDYPAPVWARFQAPEHGGLADVDTVDAVSGEAENRAAGLHVRLWAWVDAAGVITVARFEALGCPTTLAVGDWLAAALHGRRMAERVDIDAPGIMAALEIPESHRHCALVGEDAVRALGAANHPEKESS